MAIPALWLWLCLAMSVMTCRGTPAWTMPQGLQQCCWGSPSADIQRHRKLCQGALTGQIQRIEELLPPPRHYQCCQGLVTPLRCLNLQTMVCFVPGFSIFLSQCKSCWLVCSAHLLVANLSRSNNGSANVALRIVDMDSHTARRRGAQLKRALAQTIDLVACDVSADCGHCTAN